MTTVINFPAVSEYFEVSNDEIDIELCYKENYLLVHNTD